MLQRNTTAEASVTEALHFLVGRDRSNRWIVIETSGCYGGIFTDRDTAVRYARFESGSRTSSIEVTSEVLCDPFRPFKA
jgi:hypothetical protein